MNEAETHTQSQDIHQDIHKAAAPDFGPEEMVTKRAARDLILSYSGYMAAIYQQDSVAVRCWGPILIEDQKAAGIEMNPEDGIRDVIALHSDAPTGGGAR